MASDHESDAGSVGGALGFLDGFATSSDDEDSAAAAPPRAAAPPPPPPPPPPTPAALTPPYRATMGCVYDSAFLAAVASTFTPHFGAENFAQSLYTHARFLKPAVVVEVGAGYSTPWLLAALNDNELELAATRARLGTTDPRYSVAAATAARDTMLYSVDNREHEHEMCTEVELLAERLGLSAHYRSVVGDVFDAAVHGSIAGGGEQIDLIVADFGAADRLQKFWDCWWPRLRPLGTLVVHSTVTNHLSRMWLEGRRALVRSGEADFECLSLLEPHKRLQNSFTIFQKRSGAVDGMEFPGEPIFTRHP